MKNATIPKQIESMDDISEGIYTSKLPSLDRGSIYYGAFITSSPEDQFMQVIRDLPSEDRMPTLISRLRTSQLKYTERVLGAWVSAVERSLGRDNTMFAERFKELASRWHDETDHLSSPSSITNNDTYMTIISMGEPVIPLILEDLQERGGDWYRALRILSGTDPVPTEVRGDVPRMKEAWFRWGRDRGYIR